jgi:predicted nucleic acid-binding Zn ribbon protein
MFGHSTCKVCGTQFPKTRELKIFCSVKCQQKYYNLTVKATAKRKTQIETMYRKVEGYSDCTFCGAPASSYDHFLPISFVLYCTQDEIDRLIMADMLLLLPSCLECNFLLSDKKFSTIIQKREALQRMLLNKYSYLINKPRDLLTERDKLNRRYLLARISWMNPQLDNLIIDQSIEKPKEGSAACILCGKPFRPNEEWELFCSSTCAKEFKLRQNRVNLEKLRQA